MASIYKNGKKYTGESSNVNMENYYTRTEANNLIPTTLPADGGNSDTVNGHTVKVDVPEDAVFTDTVYDDTTLANRVTAIEEDYLTSDDKEELTEAIATAKSEAIETILGEAVSEDFDTLKEVADWIQADTTNSAELITRVSDIESDYVKSEDIEDFVLESTLTDNYYSKTELYTQSELDIMIPTKVSELSNDSGYLTASTANYLSKSGGTMDVGANIYVPSNNSSANIIVYDEDNSVSVKINSNEVMVDDPDINKTTYISASGVDTPAIKVDGNDVIHTGNIGDYTISKSGITMDENAKINMPSSGLGACVSLKDNYIQSDLYADGLYISDSDSGESTNVCASNVTSPELYTDRISAKTSGKRIAVSSGLDVNDLGAASATIPWFDGNTSFDGAINVNSTVTAVDGFIGDLNGNAKTATTATTATKLSNTSAIGSSTKPVYFNANGVPVAGNYTLGAACAKGVVTSVTSGNSNLVTSNGVYNAINNFYDSSRKIVAATAESPNTYTGTVTAMLIAGSDNDLSNGCSEGIVAGRNNTVGNSYCMGLFGSDNIANNTNSVIGNTLIVGTANSITTYLENDIVVGSSNYIAKDLYESLVVGTDNGIYDMTYHSIIAGYGNYISGYNSVKAAFGFGANLDITPYSFAIGHYNSYVDGSESGTGGSAFVIGNGTSSAYANAMYIRYDGAVFSDGAYNTYGADYAEFVEWEDGNTNEEDRVAKFVTLHGDKLVIANSGDYIAGVVSAAPSIIGNLGGTGWQGKYLKDDFGRWLTKEVIIVDEETEEEHITTERIVNPDYDPAQEYIPRDERVEWSPVGMLGFLRVYDDGTCEIDGYCKCADGGIATSATVEENSFLTPIYRVVNRITDNIVEIYFR